MSDLVIYAGYVLACPEICLKSTWAEQNNMNELLEYITAVNAMKTDKWIKLEVRKDDFSIVVWENNDIVFSAYNMPFERIKITLEHIKLEMI